MSAVEDLVILTVAEAAELARLLPTPKRYLGMTAEGHALYGKFGFVVVDPRSRRRTL